MTATLRIGPAEIGNWGQTPPLDRNTPCVLSYNRVDGPRGKKTSLKLRVSHHPHGDWQLRVLADGQVLADQTVITETAGPDEWLDVAVNLSPFAGHRIKLSIENVDVPKGGCPSPVVGDLQINENLDDKTPRKKNTAAKADE